MNNTLLSSYSGIKTHQFGLDSISNNIANVNTVGYRESRPEFETLFAPSSSVTNTPTSNEINLGVKASSNAISTKSGSYRVSDGDYHMAYQGKGWFVVGEKKDGELEVNDGKLTQKQQNFFTRDGSFGQDHSGFLVNPRGYYVYGINLGKIKEGVFTSATQEEDIKNLASNKLSPLQIPQDLKFAPLQTTKVDLSLNLNKTQDPTNAYEAFSLNGNFDTSKFLSTDANTFFLNQNPLDLQTNNEATIIIKNQQGEEQTYTFTYGNQGKANNQFQTFKELQDLIKEKTGANLELSLQDKSIALTLSNPSIQQSSITATGSFFRALGMSGEDEGIKLNIQSYNPTQTYQPNDLVTYLGMTFRKTGQSGSSNPLENPQEWQVADTQNVPAYNANKTYQEGEVVQKDGNIYLMGKNNQFDKIADSTTLSIPTYNAQDQYGSNSIVSYQDKLYERIGTTGNSNPLQDAQNWKEISSKPLQSKALEVPHYQSSVEIFDKNGNKFLLLSDYYLTSLDNNQSPQKWEVKSQIIDPTSKKPIGSSQIHELSFGADNTPSSQPIELELNGEKITYNISGTGERKSSDFPYTPSEITQVEQDGKSAGVLTDTAIDDDGVIYLKFSNGAQEAMGRVGIMSFTNDQGLSKIGGNLFGLESIIVGGEKQLKSGKPTLGWNESGKLQYGNVKQGYLETSNVDVGNALTELVLMQRGYSMNAKTFTTGDEMIKEAINLKK